LGFKVLWSSWEPSWKTSDRNMHGFGSWISIDIPWEK
jgi:hypothetical protein